MDTVAFYGNSVDEQWTRYDQHARIEEYVLHRSLDRYMPAPPSTVVDVGGGNGRHAFHLADRGYRVHLCDVTPALVDDARDRNAATARPLESILVGDARALPWGDDSADAALLLGPMYCLHDGHDRRRALAEVVRVVRPGGVVVLQHFSRASALRWLLIAAPVAAAEFDWQTFLDTGSFRDAHIPDPMRVHYYSTPEEATAEVTAAGLDVIDVRGMDGPDPGWGQMKLAGAPTRIVAQWGEIAYHLGGQAAYRCMSAHLLVVAKKAEATDRVTQTPPASP